jgi:hypothetical protein
MPLARPAAKLASMLRPLRMTMIWNKETSLSMAFTRDAAKAKKAAEARMHTTPLDHTAAAAPAGRWTGTGAGACAA